MKKIFCYILLVIFLAPISVHAAPPGGGYNGWRFFFASFSVSNPAGNPVGGVNVKLFVQIYGTEGDGIATLYGTTNSEGWVNLSTTLYYQGYEEGHYMLAYLNDDRYTVLSSSNTSTTTSYNLYPDFEVVLDLDQNGINDNWELPLAEQFCPNLTLHSGDQGVRPVPVEIMDRNGDGELDWQDVIVDVYTVAGNPIGAFSPSQIYIPDVIYKYLYPYYHPEEVVDTWVDANNDGCFSCSGDGVAPGHRILHTHFEWGAIGETTPSAWYSHWNTKMAQLSSDMRYVKGTTYAHLFKDGNDIVIQYWFFYPFNACANRHEGEAEHINVVVNSQNPSQAQINKVVYYYHHKKAVKNVSQITIVDQTHPKVYVGGYVNSFGMSGNGSHGSYWRAGWHEDINNNIPPDDEYVDGNGLVIDFDNYSNIIILPRFSHVNNGDNNINPYIDPYGNNLNFMVFNGFWGCVLSEPSAGYKTFSALRGILAGWTFGAGLYIAEKWFDLPEDVGNIAIAGFPQNVNWEEKGY